MAKDTKGAPEDVADMDDEKEAAKGAAKAAGAAKCRVRVAFNGQPMREYVGEVVRRGKGDLITAAIRHPLTRQRVEIECGPAKAGGAGWLPPS